MKKRIITLVLAAIMALSLFTACSGGGTQAVNAATYVSLSINPAVELVVDDDNKVISINCVNEDAEVLLAETNLIGMNLEDATQLFTNLAVNAGYMNVDATDNEITINVINEDSAETEKIEKTLFDKLNIFFKNNGINGRISKETLETYGQQAAELGVSAGKMKLILRALDVNPELILEDLKDMPTNEILAVIHSKIKKEKINAGVRTELNADITALKEEYADMFTLREEIENIEESLGEFTGTDEDKALLEAELEDKTAQYKSLKEEFNNKLEILKDAAKEESITRKEQQKEELKQRINEYKEKIEQHMKELEEQLEQEFEQSKDNGENYEQWMQDKFEQWNNESEQEFEQWKNGIEN